MTFSRSDKAALQNVVLQKPDLPIAVTDTWGRAIDVLLGDGRNSG